MKTAYKYPSAQGKTYPAWLFLTGMKDTKAMRLRYLRMTGRDLAQHATWANRVKYTGGAYESQTNPLAALAVRHGQGSAPNPFSADHGGFVANHPWMTFFIALAALGTGSAIVRAIANRPIPQPQPALPVGARVYYPVV